MLHPRALDRGDRIALLTPAGPARHPGAIRAAARGIESLGFHVRMSPWAHDSWRYLAGPDDARIREMHWAFSEPDIDGILCFRGGYGTLRLLPRLDYSIIRNNPKVFVGMSDITAFQLATVRNANLITFSGPMPSLTETNEFTPFSAASLVRAITGNDNAPTSLREGPEDPAPAVLSGGVASGLVLGGNLSTIVSMIGMPFQVPFDGSILIMEEINEAPYRVDRMLTQLLLGGCLDGVAGIGLGRFHGCYDQREDQIIEVLHERLSVLGVPIIYGLAVGHQPDVITWPQGCPGVIDSSKGAVVIRESGVVACSP